MSAEKRSISAPKELLEKAEARAASFGSLYPNFSRYLQALIEADVHYAPEHKSDFLHTRPFPNIRISSGTQEEAEQIVRQIGHEVDVRLNESRDAGGTTPAPAPPPQPGAYRRTSRKSGSKANPK